jgi:hypothetical protein
MASDIAINLDHVCAIFEHCFKQKINTWFISDERTVFSYNWGDLGATYGAPFADLLEIIAEEKEVIIPIDAGYMRQFPDKNEVQQVRQNCKTVLRTRSMPHNRAHWIMRKILLYCRWQQPPRTAGHNTYCFPTQVHINLMIANHREFLTWVRQCDISEMVENDDYDSERDWQCVKEELYPHAFGTIEASFRKIDEYFRAQHYDSYHLIQVLHLPRTHGVPLQQEFMHDAGMMRQLPNLLKKNRIPVKMAFFFRLEDLWTTKCMRTFKKPATVRHQKRIDREIRMSNYFLQHTVPVLCDAGIIHRDTVANIMKYCHVARPAVQ